MSPCHAPSAFPAASSAQPSTGKVEWSLERSRRRVGIKSQAGMMEWAAGTPGGAANVRRRGGWARCEGPAEGAWGVRADNISPTSRHTVSSRCDTGLGRASNVLPGWLLASTLAAPQMRCSAARVSGSGGAPSPPPRRPPPPPSAAAGSGATGQACTTTVMPLSFPPAIRHPSALNFPTVDSSKGRAAEASPLASAMCRLKWCAASPSHPAATSPQSSIVTARSVRLRCTPAPVREDTW